VSTSSTARRALVVLTGVAFTAVASGPATAKRGPPPDVRPPWTEGSCADIIHFDDIETLYNAAAGHLHFVEIIGAERCPDVTYTLYVYDTPFYTGPDANATLLATATAGPGIGTRVRFDIVDVDLVRPRPAEVWLVGTTSDTGGVIDTAGPLPVPDGSCALEPCGSRTFR